MNANPRIATLTTPVQLDLYQSALFLPELAPARVMPCFSKDPLHPSNLIISGEVLKQVHVLQKSMQGLLDYYKGDETEQNPFGRDSDCRLFHSASCLTLKKAKQQQRAMKKRMGSHSPSQVKCSASST